MAEGKPLHSSRSLSHHYFNRVAELSQTITVEGQLTLENLLSTIINRDEVEKWIKQPVKLIPSP